MKKLLIGFLTLFSLFGISTQGDTDVDLKSLECMDDDVVLTLQATSDNMMVLVQDFTYNPDDFELESVDYNSYFTYTQGKQKENDDGTVTIKMLFDSKYAFKSIEYVQIHLKALKNNMTSSVKISDIHSSDIDYKNETVYGSIYELTISDSEAKVVKEKETLSTQVKNWMLNHKTLLIIFLIILLIIMIIDKYLHNKREKKRRTKQAFTDVEPKVTTLPNGQKQYFTDTATAVPQTAEQKQEEKQAQQDLQTIEEKEKYDPISDDIYKGKYEVFILLLLVGSLIFIPKIYAESTVNTQTIRDNIANEKEYNEDLDINKDDKVDIVDLVYSIGTSNVTNKGYINFNTSEENSAESAAETTTQSTEQVEMQDMWDTYVR